MEQFVPADWRSSSMGDALAPSRGQDGGLLWCGMHSQPPPRVAECEHEAALWFQYPVVEDPLERDLFSEIFGEMREAAGSDTAGDREPPRASGATSCRTMVTSSSTRPKPPGAASCSSSKRKQRDTAESPSEVMPDAEESDSGTDAVTTRGLAQKTTTGKRRRAAQEHNLSERRRRDRINEKMRALQLQELVPHSNKTDKASMLDEAIEYLKSLQLQVQIMWTTGGGMAPASAMFPASGAHRYMQRFASTRSRMPPFRTCVHTSSLNDTKLS